MKMSKREPDCFSVFLRLSAGFPLCCAPFEAVVIKEARAPAKRNKRVLI